MSRLFPPHPARRVQSLDGEWDLFVPESGTMLAVSDYAKGRRFEYPVPSAWEMIPELVNYRGEAVARKKFETDVQGRARLVFKGASHTARVCVDGVCVGEHVGNGFVPFVIDLPQLRAGSHELLVQLSNAHGELSALHVPNDYYNYGGLTRPVELQQFAGMQHIEWLHVNTLRSGGGWRAEVRVALHNRESRVVRGFVEVLLAGQTARASVALPPGDSTHRIGLDFDATVATWSPAAPNLHRVDATWLDEGGEVIDGVRDRIGFRSFEIDGSRFRLNGEVVRLVGFCRHEDHPHFGCALPVAQMERDLELILQSGANAVRTTHYPNDERFLDLCDERGVLVWEENHARGLSLEQMRHPRFREQCAECNEAMVRWHHNHPSIVLWGILNECASDTPEGRAMYAEQFEQIRRLDPQRPVTFASCAAGRDLCQDLVDVVSWNTYYNWYHHADVATELERTLAYAREHGGAGKPFIMSEFGAGALPGYRDPIRKAKWSEEYQRKALTDYLEVLLADERIAGAFIWQICDVRVDDAWAMKRPRTMNNKGVVDEHRRPKLALEAVARALRAAEIGSRPVVAFGDINSCEPFEIPTANR